MITRQAAIDYLCVTRYIGGSGPSLYEIARELDEEGGNLSRESHRMQYQGRKGEQWFYGSAQQAGERHEMLAAWGDLAHSVAHLVASAMRKGMGVKVTRMDVQVTEATGVTVDLPALGEVLRRTWQVTGPRGGRLPKITWFDDADGRHTLYIGSRTSRAFARLYNKLSDDEVFMRAEWEYKQEAAVVNFDAFRADGTRALQRIVAAELNRLPVEARPYLTAFEHHRDDTAMRQVVMLDDGGDAATMQWIRTSVATCLGRMMRTEHESELRAILEQLLSY